MNTSRVPDALLDALVIRWKPGPDRFLTRAEVPPGQADAHPVLRHVCTLLDWPDALLLAEGVAARQSRGFDLFSVSYPGAPAPAEVLLADGSGQRARVGIAAFERLMARLFDTLVRGGEAEAAPQTRADWWPAFTAAARAVAERAARG